MIVLGESGSPEAIGIFEKEIANPKQTLWVKLWAIEGIKKIKEFGGRMSADAEAKAAKVISDFLDNPKVRPLPWPIQLRGLDALAHLRQGFLPNQPSKAHMANTAMRFLADPEARLEVRAEAARALGLMQITSAVSKYNFYLPAQGAGQLAADLGTQINALYSDNPPREENRTKAKYLVALLIGPVYEAFDGISTQARQWRPAQYGLRTVTRLCQERFRPGETSRAELRGTALFNVEAIQGAKEDAIIPGCVAPVFPGSESAAQPPPGPGWWGVCGGRWGGGRGDRRPA